MDQKANQNQSPPPKYNPNIQPSLNGVTLEQLEEALRVLENF